MPDNKNKKTIRTGRLVRTLEMDRSSIDQEARTVALSFSSDEPYERWFGVEILDHNPESVRLERLKKSGPLLLDHDRTAQIGVVEKVSIDGHRATAVVRFGRSDRAEEVFQDVLDGIRSNVSVGYYVHRMKLEEQRDDAPDIYRAVDWEPLEVSLVSVPADITVGVGREDDGGHETVIEIQHRSEEMPDKVDKKEHAAPAEERQAVTVVDRDAIAAQVRREERARVREIQAIAERHEKLKPAAEKAIAEGISVDEFRKQALDSLVSGEFTPADESPEIGMTERDIEEFSLLRAIRAQVSGDWSDAGLELECSRAVAEKLGREPQGFFLPYDWQKARLTDAQRDMVVGTPSAGGYTVATNLLAASFIEMLRHRMMVRRLGARVMGGLVGDIAIPKQTGGATAYWVAESGSPTESQQTLAQVAMTPHTLGAFTDISRKLLIQSSIDVEQFVKADLAKTVALAIDLAAINGSGASNQPLGILNTTGIGSTTYANGSNPGWGDIVNLETALAQDDADVGTMAYLTEAAMRGTLKQVEKASNTAQFIWENSNGQFGSMNGYTAAVSNQVPDGYIIFANWDDLIIGEWSGTDVLVDPYTGGTSGTLRIVVLQDVDVAVRHPESFAEIHEA